MRGRYFHADGDGLAVGDELRALVRFDRHNLIHDPTPPLGQAPFHLILCRNVLIYFDTETVGRVLESLDRALAPSGTLVLGVADALCASASRLAETAPDPSVREPRRRRRELPRQLGHVAVAAAVKDLAMLVEASDRHSSEEVIAQTSRLIEHEPLNAAAHYRRGLAELESGSPAAAVTSLRGALYADPNFGLAAFKLGGAHEALGDVRAARRAYRQALRALDPHEHHEPFLAQVDIAEVAAAAQARLDVLSAPVA